MGCSRVVLFTCAALIAGVTLADTSSNENGNSGLNYKTDTTRFTQTEFVIALWNDPPADATMDFRYKQIAEANFNLVIAGSDVGAVTPEKVKRMLRICRKYKLKALAPDNISKDPIYYDNWKDDEYMGVRVIDEPNASQFKWLADRMGYLRKRIPGKLPLVNLYPDYATPRQLRATSYEEYVRRFVKETNPEVLCMDHYPVMRPDCDARSGYCKNLETIRKYALRSSIPFWNLFLSIPWGDHYSPTEYHLRWQINTSLVYGAKGIGWFTYYTPPGDCEGSIFRKGGALVRRDGSLTRLYYQAQRINKELKNIGPTLMALTSEKVYRLKPFSNPPIVLEGSPVKNITRSWKKDCPFDLIVGSFRHSDGRRTVMINNYDMNFGCWLTVTFDTHPDQIMEVDRRTGQILKVIDDSPAIEGLQISLDAADSRLFLLPGKANK